jgi:hypothetical protein
MIVSHSFGIPCEIFFKRRILLNAYQASAENLPLPLISVRIQVGVYYWEPIGDRTY